MDNKKSSGEIAGDTVRKWGYSSPSLLASIKEDDASVRTFSSGSALRAEIEKSETLGFLKAALVPSNGKWVDIYLDSDKSELMYTNKEDKVR